MGKAFLRVSYSDRRDCFVALPRNFTEGKSGITNYSDQHGALKVEAGDCTTYLGAGKNYSGRDDTLEINGLFADKIGLKDGIQVGVSRVSCTSCDRVFVEPASVNDWEILELHAKNIESSLLKNVRVVWSGQILPIWVTTSICVFVNIGKFEPSSEYAILQQNTEVIVAPKDRQTSRLTTQISRERTRKKSGPVRIVETVDYSPSRLSGDSGFSSGRSSESSTSTSSSSEHGDSGAIMSLMKRFWYGTPVMKQVEPQKVEKIIQTEGSEVTQEVDSADAEFSMLLRVQPMTDDKYSAKSRGASDRVKSNPATEGSPPDGQEPSMSNKTSQKSPPKESKSRRIEFEQPLSVFIDFQTVQKAWPTETIIPRHFLAKMTKILSPHQKVQYKPSSGSGNPEKSANGGENGAQLEKSLSGEKGSKKEKQVELGDLCIVVRVVLTDHTCKRFRTCQNHVLIPDKLRLMFSLEATSKVLIETLDFQQKVTTKLTIYPLMDLPKNYNRDTLSLIFKVWVENMTSDSCPLVLNKKNIVEIRMPYSDEKGKPVFGEFVVTMSTPDSTAGLYYLLIYPRHVDNLDLFVMSKAIPSLFLPTQHLKEIDLSAPKGNDFCLGGVDHLFKRATAFLDSCLAMKPLAHELFGDQPGVQSGCLLICGPKGSGKTVFCRELGQQYSKVPNLAYVLEIDCSVLRGKSSLSLEKTLATYLHEAEWRQPSIVILDDLDNLCSRPSGPEQEASLEALASMKNSEVIKSLICHQMEKKSRVAIVATVKSMSSINVKLTPSRGIHFFQEVIHIQPPNQEQRREILRNLLEDHKGISAASLDNLDLGSIAQQTEGYIPRDLSKIIDRAFHSCAVHNIDQEEEECTLEMSDFETSLSNFKPTALYNISLHVAEELGWDDVGGLQDAKKVLQETLLLPAKHPKLFAQCPLRLRSGILLYGPPGTGKTLLAGVIAKECKLNFISIKGPELLSKYIGASEQAVRDTFIRAQSAKPCILFFDEFDSMAPRRGHDSTGVTDRVVNQLLTQLDGVETIEGVYVLAASNRPDLIDPALLRPGRLDKSILCPLPDEQERLEILRALSKTMSFAQCVDLAEVARVCKDFTGADFKGLLYSAQLKAIHVQFDHKELQVSPRKSRGKQSDMVSKSVSAIKYIPKIEDGVVEPTPEMQHKLEEQVASILQPLRDQMVTPSKQRRRSSAVSVSRAILVTQQQLMEVAGEMKPSVSPAERLRYLNICDTFVSTRGGNFQSSRKISDKRATLA